jgi:hypothetical protein
LKDLYHTEINNISFIVVLRSIGALIGTFLGKNDTKDDTIAVMHHI